MRSPKLLLVLFLTVALWPARSGSIQVVAQEGVLRPSSWKGLLVLPSKPEVTSKYIDSNGQTHILSDNWLSAEVKKEEGSKLLVRTDFQEEGWVNKDEVVAFEDAVAFFTARIHIRSDDAFAHGMRGLGWALKQEYDKALLDAGQAIQLAPEASRWRLLRGHIFSRKGDDESAIHDLDEAIRLDTKSPWGYIYRASALAGTKEYKRALEDSNKAIEIDSNNIVALTIRGSCYNLLDDFDRGAADYGQVIRLNPKAGWAYEGRGRALLGKQDCNRAIADFSMAIELEPDSYHPYYNRGTARLRVAQPELAIDDFNVAIRLNPRNAHVFLARGLAYRDAKAFDRATADLKEATRLDPRLFSAYYNLGRIFATCSEEKYRDGKMAVEYSIKACELSKWKNGAALGILAAAYAENKQFDEAVKWAKKSLDDPAFEKKYGAKARANLIRYEQGKPLSAD